MDILDLVVVGGGAAGFMTAINAAENGVKNIQILESSSKVLEKVRISGGGRCNVTNATWIPTELAENYPRGGIKLLESFSRFASGDVYEWFEERGLLLKIEDDQRVFPISDSSLDVVNCLKRCAIQLGVEISIKNQVKKVMKSHDDLFKIYTSADKYYISKKLLIATGGNPSGYKLAEALGHNLVKPVPSLFTFTCKDEQLKECKGISIKNLNLKLIVNDKVFINKGDLLITHWGFSGPGILKLSSIASRELYEAGYKFKLIITWSNLDYEELYRKINYLREINGKSNLFTIRPLPNITKRLWIFLLKKIEIDLNKTWSEIISAEREKIINLLLSDEYEISGKGPFGDEFVTSGGVSNAEVSFKTMESLICEGLYFSGEVLDVDGITGGFNFQHCWTSGWLAGKALADVLLLK